MSNSCPKCSKILDAADATPGNKDEKPSQGDLTVCIYCGVLLVFDSIDPFTYHILTKQERQNIDRETFEKLVKVQLAIKSMWYNHNR